MISRRSLFGALAAALCAPILSKIAKVDCEGTYRAAGCGMIHGHLPPGIKHIVGSRRYVTYPQPFSITAPSIPIPWGLAKSNKPDDPRLAHKP